MDPESSMSIFGQLGTQTARSTHLKQGSAGSGRDFAQHLEALYGTAAQPANIDASPRSRQTLVDDPGVSPALLAFLGRLWNATPAGELSVSSPSDDALDASSRERFVQSLLESARQAADQLGTSVDAVLAVAALETGWGQHVIHTAGGDSSHNLFGIKADAAWHNDQVIAMTTEHRDGFDIRISQPFRTYSNAAASVADFAEFIQANPRYAPALKVAADPDAFIEAIHHAGYATDPDYADKAKSLRRQVMDLIETAR